jgi:DNA polymerase V
VQELKITGFPSPAASWSEKPLDILNLLAPNPVSTFFMRLEEDVPQWALLEGDILVVDRSLEPRTGSLAVVVENGALVLRVIGRSGARRSFALPEGKESSGIDIETWGIVRGVARLL